MHLSVSLPTTHPPFVLIKVWWLRGASSARVSRVLKPVSNFRPHTHQAAAQQPRETMARWRDWRESFLSPSPLPLHCTRHFQETGWDWVSQAIVSLSARQPDMEVRVIAGVAAAAGGASSADVMSGGALLLLWPATASPLAACRHAPSVLLP